MRTAGIVFLISLLAPAGSWAQVFKCQDAQGRTVYSDVGCAANNTGRLMQRERTLEEKWQEREEARNAQMAKQERQMIEAERVQRELDIQAMRAAAQVPASNAPHKGYAERLAERNASVKSVFEKPQLRAQRGLPPLPNHAADEAISANPAPSGMTHCAGGFCHDNQGTPYSRSANGRFMHNSATGQTCSVSANGRSMVCP